MRTNSPLRRFFAALSLAALAAGTACAHKASSAAVAPPVPSETAAGPTKDQGSPVPVDPDDPVWGSPTAPVTIVEFADFECVFCKRAEPALAALRKQYGPAQLRLVWKHFPLAMHAHARPAAQAASAVLALGGPDAFWKFHDAILPEAQLGDTFDAEATAAGVDLNRFHERLASGLPAEQVGHDLAQGEKLGVEGTPAFFINGAFISGALPLEVFQQVVDEALKQAKGLLEKGTPSDELYAAASKLNYSPPGAGGDEANEPPEDTTTVWRVPVGASPARGPKTAPVTIVVFSDFQCPYCKLASETLSEVEGEFAGKVRIVWKNYPLTLHPHAEAAAELALEARAEKGEEGFWSAHDKLFAAQKDFSPATFTRLGEELGLDRARVDKAIGERSHRADIQADQRLAAELDAEGAPQTFINGRRLVGAQPAGAFRALIQAELEHAAAVAKSGVPPERLYETIIAEGQTSKEPEEITLPSAPGVSAPVRGPANAKVSIVEFADFECSFCQRAEPTVRSLVDERASSGHGADVQIVWMDLPLAIHAHAELAAEAGRAAFAQKGNAGFWPLHDAMFAHREEPNGLTVDAIGGYALAAKLDAGRLKADLAGAGDAADGHSAPTKFRGEVEAEEKVAQAAGFTGTPTFVVVGPAGKRKDGGWTGYVVRGAEEPGAFLRAIDLALHHGDAAAHPRSKH